MASMPHVIKRKSATVVAEETDTGWVVRAESHNRAYTLNDYHANIVRCDCDKPHCTTFHNPRPDSMRDTSWKHDSIHCHGWCEAKVLALAEKTAKIYA